MKKNSFIINTIKKIVEIAGFNISLQRRTKKNDSYESVLPIANYAPWLTDKYFIEIYKIAKEYTLVDKYRCYELWKLVEQSAKLDGALIEVGVWRGGTGGLIAKMADMSKIKDNVYLCDTFSGVVKAGEKDKDYKGGEHSDTSKEIAQQLINKLNLNNVKILEGMFPEQTAHLINEERFRFCHVDVDVYQSAKDVVEWVWPKLVVGGIIVFDDYGFKGCEGVVKYIKEEENKKDKLFIHNLNGHAIIIKLQ